jgi:UDP-glucose 4-epimerase
MAGSHTGGMTGLAGLDVVVTGGAGFIGSHLVERLAQDGVGRLTVIDDLSTGSTANLASAAGAVEMQRGDIRDPAVAKRAGDADVVFHLAVRNVRASIREPAENLSVNADGTLSVLEAMRLGRQGRFVYVSSSEVYGIPPSGDYRESTLPAPTTVYGAGKLAGELVALAYHRTYGMDTRVVRPFNNYGPRSHFEGDSGEVLPKFILRALAGRPLVVHGDGSQTRDFMYVSDTARWLVQLATLPSLVGEVVNIGTGRDIAITDLAAMVLEATGSSSEVAHVAPRPGDLPRLCADVTKVSTHVPFTLPTTFEEGLAATIAHFRGRDVEALLAREVGNNWT